MTATDAPTVNDRAVDSRSDRRRPIERCDRWTQGARAPPVTRSCGGPRAAVSAGRDHRPLSVLALLTAHPAAFAATTTWTQSDWSGGDRFSIMAEFHRAHSAPTFRASASTIRYLRRSSDCSLRNSQWPLPCSSACLLRHGSEPSRTRSRRRHLRGRWPHPFSSHPLSIRGICFGCCPSPDRLGRCRLSSGR